MSHHPASVLRPPLKARQKVASEWLPGRHSQGFVPHLRRRPNAAAPRAPRAPLHAVSARGRRCLQDYRLTQRACPGTQSPGVPSYLHLRPNRARTPDVAAAAARSMAARPCVLSFPAFARALDSCSIASVFGCSPRFPAEA